MEAQAAELEVGSAVRLVEPPAGASFAKFRGRSGVVVSRSAGGSAWVVAVARLGADLLVRTDVAENAFEFLCVDAADFEPLPPGLPTPPTPRRLAKRRRTQVRPAADPVPRGARLVAVIVPFRDAHSAQQRAAHLRKFVPHVSAMLRGCAADFRVIIVEQAADGRKFNRGKLLNAGYRLAREKFDADALVFHDVDLLPSDDLGPAYSDETLPGRPVHIARVWDRYSDNEDYFGGVAAWNAPDFERINGFPNNYWGWGGEDDEMMRRCKTVWGDDFHMGAPAAGNLIDLEDMDITQKVAFLKQFPEWKCNVRWELQNEHAATWTTNGLRTARGATFDFDVVATEELGPNAFKYTVTCGLNGDWADAHAAEKPDA